MKKYKRIREEERNKIIVMLSRGKSISASRKEVMRK
jgi:hypothetical protein